MYGLTKGEKCYDEEIEGYRDFFLSVFEDGEEYNAYIYKEGYPEVWVDSCEVLDTCAEELAAYVLSDEEKLMDLIEGYDETITRQMID